MKTQTEIQEDALVKIIPYKRFSCNIGTGVGKSFLVLKHMNHFYHESLTVLIVIPKTALIQNWIDEIKKQKMLHLLPHVTFVTYRSFHLNNFNYDWIYLDECHNLKSDKHYFRINTCTSNIAALTGTFFKEEDRNYNNLTEILPLVYEYKTSDSVENGILNDYTIIIHKIPMSKEERKKYNSISYVISNTSNYNALSSLRITRMKLMQKMNSKALYAKELLKTLTEKSIVFCETIDHAKNICSDNYHSKNSKIKNEKNLSNFVSGTINKLSSVGQLNEGVNVPNLVNGIILHTYSNNVKAHQRIGRLLRLGASSGLKSKIHVLVYENTIDVEWCKNGLSEFNKQKIKIAKPEIINLLLKNSKLSR
jgi:superfamily II DNA or RNA helicase